MPVTRLGLSMKCFSQVTFGAVAIIGLMLVSGTLQVQGATRIVAWGDIKYDVTPPSQPATGLGNGIYQIAAGDFHSIALTQDGSVLAWGDNRFGQTSLPEVLQDNPAVQIAAGNIHNLALTHAGTVL